MAARQIQSLADLQAAAKLAARDGKCVVELADGTTLTLLPGGDHHDDDEDPGLVQALESGLDQLERGKYQTTAQVLARLKQHRQSQHG